MQEQRGAAGGAAPPASALFRPSFLEQVPLDCARTGLLHPAPWVPMVEAPAYYPRDSWLAAMHEWIAHPERNSSNIRRAEVWGEHAEPHPADHAEPDAHGADVFVLRYRCIRRLLPRRTQLDRGMLQECTVYEQATEPRASVVYTTLRMSDQDSESPSPDVLGRQRSSSDYPSAGDQVPYYHPAVRCVRFDYIGAGAEDARDAEEGTVPAQGAVRVCFVPFAGSDLRPDARLGRTALSLLRMMHQHSYGCAQAYVKRVYHDIVVPRDEFQDLYVQLRQRHAHTLIDTWREKTDPRKHVFEDIGIAAWLMLLWKRMFGAMGSTQPPGGFVDLGCGNGLLVHLLHSEGYHGYGVDTRARKSWEVYAAHGADLRVATLSMPELLEQLKHGKALDAVPPQAFFIGNHADELTPWVPVLAAHAPQCAGFVNLPCCAWTLEGVRFVPTEFTLDDKSVFEWATGRPYRNDADGALPPMSAAPPPAALREPQSEAELVASTLWHLRRCANTQGTHSKHLAYNAYVAQLHLQSGWRLETEALRIPSTKNWAFVGRAHSRTPMHT